MDLTEFIYTSNQCATPQELTDKFLSFLNQFGLTRFVMSEMSHDSRSLKENNHGILVNYPEEWMSHYVANHYIEHDPVYQTALVARKPFTWDTAYKNQNVSTVAERVMHEAHECKLYDGIALSIFQPLGQIIGMGLAASEKGAEYDKNDLSIVHAAANQFFVAYADLVGMNDTPNVEIKLTEREREVVLWLARGKTKSEISDILVISESTIKRYCESVYKKLNVNERGQAVAKSLRMGLIKPF